jgi:hypothetical protein
VIGKTLFRWLASGFKCSTKQQNIKETYIDQRYKKEYEERKRDSHHELRQQLKHTYERFNNTPDTAPAPAPNE